MEESEGVGRRVRELEKRERVGRRVRELGGEWGSWEESERVGGE